MQGRKKRLQERLIVALRGGLCAAIAALAGCGGSSSSNDLIDKPTFALDQSTASCTTTAEGSCSAVTVMATVAHDQAASTKPYVWVEVNGNQLMVTSTVTATQQSDGRWQLTFNFTPNRPTGSYAGILHVGLPLGTPAPEGTRYKAAHLNYTLTVNPDTLKQPALPAAVAGVTAWSGPGGTPTRNGYVPIASDATQFSKRWMSWLLLSTGALQYAPTLADGQLLFSQLSATTGDGTRSGNAVALNEADGKQQWSATLPANPMQVIANGTDAFWLSNDTSWMITATARATGAVKASQTYSASTFWNGWAMTDAGLLLPDTKSGALSLVDTGSLQSLWSVAASSGAKNFNSWGVTADNGVVYVSVGARFKAYQVSNGAALFDTSVPTGTPDLGVSFLDYYGQQVPVLADASTALLLDYADLQGTNYLSAASRTTGVVQWRISGRFVGYPVSGGNGLFYVANQATRAIECRSLTDGTVQWSWPMPSSDSTWRNTMVLTDQHLFVATDTQTLAIDLATHQSVWTYPISGWLGMTPHGLLVVMGTGVTGWNPVSVTAFNVR